MTRFAHLLQLAGLVIVPMGLFVGLNGGEHAESSELTLLGVGGFLFLLGAMILKKKGS